MKIGVISDSHDNISNVKKSVQMFKDEKVDLVIHLGDIISPPMIPNFKGLKLKGIFGNNDGEKFKLMQIFNSIGAELKNEFFEMEEDGLKFAFYHGTVHQLTESLIKSGKYDVVMTGHTHQQVNETIGSTLHINPGTAHGFGGKASIVIFETKTKDVKFLEL